ncbi:hypothetical protein TrCOL_g10430 [Triparma columacea]|uniref:Uncharacterized protein n=1 Tax=Triparma columacea TaxID=722753 RepID=A0A9W7L846_9STRA|nr:hypothetical protein TrCOL_g10430 [Triparma columacea]
MYSQLSVLTILSLLFVGIISEECPSLSDPDEVQTVLLEYMMETCVLECLGVHVDVYSLMATQTLPPCNEAEALINCADLTCPIAAWNKLECVVNPLQAMCCGVNETDVSMPFVMKALPGEEDEEEEEEEDIIMGGSAGTRLLMGGWPGWTTAIIGVVGGTVAYCGGA